jgi:hypothetical protein
MKPSYLVSVKTSLNGGIQYNRKDVRDEHLEDGSEEQEWNTTKVISDPEEYKVATLLRAKVAGMISNKCKLTPFGLICPEGEIETVQLTEQLAQLEVEEYNINAKYTTISLNVMMGYIASDDVQAAQRIAKQMRDLATEMKRCVRAGDIEGIREAAKTANQMRAILGEEEKARVSLAVKEARDAARTITKEVVKNGKKVDAVVPALKVGAISKMRLAFIDIDEGDASKNGKAKKDKLPTANVKRMAGVEITGDE